MHSVTLIAPTLLSAALSAAAAFAGPPVNVSLLSGEEYKGELKSLDAQALVVAAEGGEKSVPLRDVLHVAPANTADEAPADPAASRVHLSDGSTLAAESFTTAGGKAVIRSAAIGEVTVPLDRVTSVRLGELDSKVTQAWDELRGRVPQRDLLVVRKGDVLDFLQGVVGDISDTQVKFLLTREVTIAREKVFGVIYSRREPPAEQPFCDVSLAGDDRLMLAALSWDAANEKLTGELPGGAKVAMPFSAVRLLDYSLGKVRYLAEIEPRRYEHTPFFDLEWDVRRNRTFDGDPLKLGGKPYARGLWIHSKTLLGYRLGGEYGKFKAVMGIDDGVAPEGDVHVVITGDGKVLLERDVRGTDEPFELDLDVTGVVMLEILVDYGADLDIADHLNLADARIIK
jgi:hypothetical protein